MSLRWSRFVAFAAALCVSVLNADAQFRKEAFSQNYNDDEAPADTSDKMFSLREYWGGITHKRTMKVGTMVIGSTVLVGGPQIYNKQYWKLPVVYGGIAAGVGSGIYFGNRYSRTGESSDALWRNLSFTAAGLCWWGQLMDGVVNYGPVNDPDPGKAAMYSLLLPGLGQAYNGEYWKIPIYVGGLVASVNYYSMNRLNYERFRRIYKEATETDHQVPIASQTALYYRNVYRRYRDYSIVAFAAVYLLQVIDANVFAAMHDFEVSDDLTLNLSPTLIQPEFQLASGGGSPVFGSSNALGLRLGFTF